MDLWPSELGHWFYGSAVNSLNKDFAWPIGLLLTREDREFCLDESSGGPTQITSNIVW